MRKLIFTGYLLPFLILSCCKDKIEYSKNYEQKLPLITSDGKGIFGCMVNGKIWVPAEYKDYAKCNYYTWGDSPDLYGTLSIVSVKNKFEFNSSAGMTILLSKRVFKKGKHPLFTVHTSGGDKLFFSKSSNYYYNYSTSDTNNYISISRLDSVNRIVSGTFQFNLINENISTDSIIVSEGRFDFKF